MMFQWGQFFNTTAEWMDTVRCVKRVASWIYIISCPTLACWETQCIAQWGRPGRIKLNVFNVSRLQAPSPFVARTFGKYNTFLFVNEIMSRDIRLYVKQWMYNKINSYNKSSVCDLWLAVANSENHYILYSKTMYSNSWKTLGAEQTRSGTRFTSALGAELCAWLAEG